MNYRIGTTVRALCCASALALPVSAVAADEIRLVCGGIGLDESAPMLASAPMHALTILFTTADGAYLSGVRTRVDNPLGDRSAEAECGPVGQIDVAKAGRYRVSTEFGGNKREHWFELKPAGGERTTLRWTE